MIPALQNSSIFSSSEIGLLFGNIVELRNLHSSMFSAFEEGKNPEKLAKIISEELPQFSIAYHQYCSNFPRATRLYSKIRKNSKTRPNFGFQNSTLRRVSKSPFEPSSPLDSSRLENSSFPTLRRTNTLLFRSTSAVFRRRTIGSVQNLNEVPAENNNNTVNFLKRKLSPRKSSPGSLFPKKEDPEVARANAQCEFLQKTLEESAGALDPALPLISFLLEPIQRVMRYPLLLKTLANDLVAEQPCPEVRKAIEAAEKLASITNMTQPTPLESKKSQKNDNEENRSPTGSEVSIPACVPKPDKKRKSFEVVRQAAQRLLRSR